MDVGAAADESHGGQDVQEQGSQTKVVLFSMARQKNDGRGRLGGRAKGTPNKVTTSVKEWLSELINANREQVEADLKKLKPRERLAVLEKFMQYVVPRQQAVSAKIDFDSLTDSQLDDIVGRLTKGINDEATD